VQHVPAPPLREPGQRRQLVDHPRGHEQPSRTHLPPVRQVDREAEHGVVGGAGQRAGAGDLPGEDLPAVAGHLRPTRGQQLPGRDALAAQVVVHFPGRGVARLPGVDDQHAAPGPGQRHGSGQPGGASADDHHVIAVGQRLAGHDLPVHVHSHSKFDGADSATDGADLTSTVAGTANGEMPDDDGPQNDDSPVGAVLAAVGPRLRALRQERGATLAQLAGATGISVSTLSRLESGHRRPALDLLLLLARAHHVPLDELVGAPETGDPRVHPRPVVRHGMTWLPLTRRPGGLQAFKLILPVAAAPAHPEQQSHEGYEWLYVLSGRLRLLLGDADLTLTTGEVAEFDTHTPHWFGSAGGTPTEALILFGPQGERLHVRARPRRG
jgi:transcriptional regulator with XRE-family HTH domain